MKLETRYEPHQIVHVVRQETRISSEPCATCRGRGTVQIRKVKFTCPSCKGDRHSKSWWEEWAVFTGQIIHITAEVWMGVPADRPNVVEVKYSVDGENSRDGVHAKEKDTFADLAEAQAEAQRRQAEKDTRP